MWWFINYQIHKDKRKWYQQINKVIVIAHGTGTIKDTTGKGICQKTTGSVVWLATARLILKDRELLQTS